MNFPFEDNIFVYVITTEAFHHYYNQKKVYQEMKGVRKKVKK
ncbi:methyltransferase domain-containing protein [Candidatus Woesearchaeota archaeon]|nr:methyltransferase domain-containing protein [Candidatus Woesearchaeota archaeon]